jgi:hypothetical protein
MDIGLIRTSSRLSRDVSGVWMSSTLVVFHKRQGHVQKSDKIKKGKYTLIKDKSVSKTCPPIDFDKFGQYHL